MVHNAVDFGLHITANAVIFTALIAIVIGAFKPDDSSAIGAVAGNQSFS